ncbi:MAG: ferritin-like domain-containing protein, partial [Bacteroidota bacterium]|nr:ferritin-like domain-containing protein [Bacteroidota bacterium]
MQEQKTNDLQTAFATQLKRKSFLKYTAISGTAMALGLQACRKEFFADFFPKNPLDKIPLTDVGGGDIGILNFAYALEQLEAAFYT